MSGITDRLAAVRQSIVEAECYASKTPTTAIERIRESIDELAAIQDALAGGDAELPTAVEIAPGETTARRGGPPMRQTGMNPMTADEYQAQTARTAQYPRTFSAMLETINLPNDDAAVRKDELLAAIYLTLGAVSEAGEIAGSIKRVLRDDGGKLTPTRTDETIQEIGDCFWYLARLADYLDVPLSQIMHRNIEKLNKRAAEGTIQGKGAR